MCVCVCVCKCWMHVSVCVCVSVYACVHAHVKFAYHYAATYPFIGTAVTHILVTFLLNVQGSPRTASTRNSNPTTTTTTTVVQTADGGCAGDVAAATARGVALTFHAACPAATCSLDREDLVQVIEAARHDPSGRVGQVKRVTQLVQRGTQARHVVGPVVLPAKQSRVCKGQW